MRYTRTPTLTLSLSLTPTPTPTPTLTLTSQDGPKANSEICTNTELSSFLNAPLQLPSKRGA